MRFLLTAALSLSLAAPALGHRLDEYLQATKIAVANDRVELEIRLTPGVEVFRTLLAKIDTDGDGVISDSEQRAYAQRVLDDLLVNVDFVPLRLHLTSMTFPK